MIPDEESRFHDAATCGWCQKEPAPTIEERFAALCERARRTGQLVTIGLTDGAPVVPITVLHHATFGGRGNLSLALDQMDEALDDVEIRVWGQKFADIPA